MKRAATSVVALLFASAPMGAVSGATSEAVPNAGLVEAAPSRGTQVLLWDQNDESINDGVVNQEFGAGNEDLDCEAADDFVLPWGELWQVTEVYAPGIQTKSGSPTSVDLWIYPDDGGQPAAEPACSELGAFVGDASTWTITLTTSCVLQGGVYWLALQANQEGGPFNGEHLWAFREARTGYAALWRNPGGGLDPQCTGWSPPAVCEVGAPGLADLLFQVYGLGTEILHNQLDAAAAAYFSDNNYLASDVGDTEAADDFEVVDPAGWSIRRVRTEGDMASIGAPASVAVRIFANAGGLPATVPTCDYPALATADPDNLDVSLPPPGCHVGVGTWWLEVQPNADSAQHRWRARSVQSGASAVWRQPNNPISQCHEWCHLGELYPASPDLLFALDGLPALVFEDDFEIENEGRWSDCSGCP